MTIDAHRLGELRSIAMHAAIADLLRADLRRLDRVRDRVRDWLAEGGVSRHYAERWHQILAGPLDQIIAVMISDDAECRALRQVSPFAGQLTAQQRWKIGREVARREGSR